MMWAVYDENNPDSLDYFIGTQSECQEWMNNNKENDRFTGCAFLMEPCL